MSSANAAPPKLIEARGIVKRFGKLLANDVAEFSVAAGEVVALLGENGAGKSTLCKILYGYCQPDAGKIFVAGRREVIATPRDAARLGIGMVFQNFSLIPALTVWENVALFLKDLPFVVGPANVQRRMAAQAERLRFTIYPKVLAGRLAVGDRQKLEILKQLLAGARVLILDEPTKVLAPQEAEGLFATIAALREDGYGIVYITHKLAEVKACADRVAVMRQGRIVGTLPGRDADESSLLRLMFADPAPPRPALKRTADPGPVVLALESVTATPLQNVSLSLCGGEILGVAGVSGNGQSALAELVLGLRRPASGIKRLWGELANTWSVRKIRARGVASIPDDPLALAAVGGLTVWENLALGSAARYQAGWDLDWARLAADMDHSAAVLRFPPLRYEVRAGVLSGGNLQRVVLTRELAHAPKLIVALYPTRGLDQRSVEALRAALADTRAVGAAILLVSEDLDELFELSDRLIVLRDGRIAGHFSAAHFSTDAVGACMVGLADAA